jgi:8-oxo-dGTP diphosphatase
MPAVGVGGVIIHDGKVLLIRRGKEPLRGRWVIPGGTLELGESLEAAVVREIREETALEVRPLDVVAVFDRIERKGADILYHYVIIDYLCAYEAGTARAGSDAAEVAWASPEELPAFDMPEKAFQVVSDSFARWFAQGPHSSIEYLK